MLVEGPSCLRAAHGRRHVPPLAACFGNREAKSARGSHASSWSRSLRRTALAPPPVVGALADASSTSPAELRGRLGGRTVTSQGHRPHANMYMKAHPSAPAAHHSPSSLVVGVGWPSARGPQIEQHRQGDGDVNGRRPLTKCAHAWGRSRESLGFSESCGCGKVGGLRSARPLWAALEWCVGAWQPYCSA